MIIFARVGESFLDRAALVRRRAGARGDARAAAAVRERSEPVGWGGVLAAPAAGRGLLRAAVSTEHGGPRRGGAPPPPRARLPQLHQRGRVSG
eukprot:2355636-Pyramimonas_sp.AAC.1